MILRPYQVEAFDATIASLRARHNPVVAMPTGSGKSAVIAALVDRCRSKDGYTLMVTHNQELVAQNYAALTRFYGADGVGVYCSGLNSKTIGTASTYGTIQTLYRALDKLPEPDAIIIDECHRVGFSGGDTKQYDALFKAFPKARKVGMSATPYRLAGGPIIGSTEKHWFDDLCISIDVPTLVAQGYLAPLISVASRVQLDLKGVKKTGGDFNLAEVDPLMKSEWITEVLKTVQKHAATRKHILVFAPTVRTAELVATLAKGLNLTALAVHGGTKDRDGTLAAWKRGEAQLMSSCLMLTTGFDFAALDCIVDLSPTESQGLHVQKLGRGTRIAPGKTDCLVLDFAGNLARHGGIAAEPTFTQELDDGTLRTVKRAAPIMNTVQRKLKSVVALEALDPMSGSATSAGLTLKVRKAHYTVKKSVSRNIEMLLCIYDITTQDGSPLQPITEFVLVEHDGYARTKAERWFTNRGGNAPRTATRALGAAYNLPTPKQITVRKAGSYYDILNTQF